MDTQAKPVSEHPPEAGRASHAPGMHDEAFVKWIPIVVPLLALFLAVMAFFIDAAVL